MGEREPVIFDFEMIQQKLHDHLRSHWRLFLLEGISFALLGMSAIVIPQVFSVVIVIFLGWLVILGGLIQLSRVLFLPKIPHFGLWVLLGILQVVLGYLLIVDPIAGVLTFTTMMVLFFSCEGILKTYLAFIMRPLPYWKSILFSGATSLLFAMVILFTWSESAPWLLGLFIGINMVILGISIIRMSLHYR